MKAETDAVLVVFWRRAEMALRWHRPVSRRSICKRRRQGRRDLQQQAETTVKLTNALPQNDVGENQNKQSKKMRPR